MLYHKGQMYSGMLKSMFCHNVHFPLTLNSVCMCVVDVCVGVVGWGVGVYHKGQMY